MTSQRRIGLWPATSLVTGNMVGSGVFLLPASLGTYGLLSLIGWGVTTVGALLLALIFAFLCRQKIRSQGGPHQFIRHYLGEKAGFYAAWGYWMLSWMSNAALIVAMAGYFSELCGGFSAMQSLMFELCVIALITGINLFGIAVAGRFEMVMTILKLVPLLGLPIIGIFFVDWTNFVWPGAEISLSSSLKTVIFLTIWGFIGVETATVPSGEVIDPHKTIARATLIGTLIAGLVYILGTFVLLGVLSQGTLTTSNAPYAQLAQTLFGGQWGNVIAAMAFLCCLGSFNGWTLVVSRIAQGAAEEGLFPKIFARKNRLGAPFVSLLISSSLTIPLIIFSMQASLVKQFNTIIDFSIALILFIYLGCILAYIKANLQQGMNVKNIAIAGGALCFIVFSLWAAGLKMLLLSFTILLAGIPFRYYMTYRRQREQALELNTASV